MSMEKLKQERAFATKKKFNLLFGKTHMQNAKNKKAPVLLNRM